jgi:uncharacterized membrane protein
MQKVLLLNREQKCWLALFGILLMSSVISIGMFAARIAPSQHGPYTSLVWNLLLAWVPLIFAWITFTFPFNRLAKLPKIVAAGFCVIVWLIFFPNAFYILTDFQHIRLVDNASPVWYDVIMLHWFSWSGLFLGLFSLYFMQKVISYRFGKILGWIFVIGAMILGSIGVYIGRFMYKNSWDLVLRPFILLKDILSFVLQNRKEATTFSLPFAFLFLFIYLGLYIFGQLISEHHNEE